MHSLDSTFRSTFTAGGNEAIVGASEPQLNTVSTLQKSAAASTATVNSTVTRLLTLVERGDAFVEKISVSDEREQLRERLSNIRQSFATVATITALITEMTRVVLDSSFAAADTD